MILIDNYDSFTYNIVQYLRELGVEPIVFKNDEITIDELKKLDFESVVISPGPGNPDKAGISIGVIREFYSTKKILGVCLGHQCIAQYFGAKVVKSKHPYHGKTSKIYFKENELFNGLEQGFEATRYHSLVVDSNSITDEIIPLAYTTTELNIVGLENPTYCKKSCSTVHLFDHSTQLIMAIKHKNYPVYGVQFHPEAILTQGGKKLLSNFLCLR